MSFVVSVVPVYSKFRSFGQKDSVGFECFHSELSKKMKTTAETFYHSDQFIEELETYTLMYERNGGLTKEDRFDAIVDSVTVDGDYIDIIFHFRQKFVSDSIKRRLSDYIDNIKDGFSKSSNAKSLMQGYDNPYFFTDNEEFEDFSKMSIYLDPKYVKLKLNN